MKNILRDKSGLKFVVLIIALLLIWYLGKALRIDTEGLQDYLRRFPVAFGAIIFITLYVVVTFFLWLSKDIFKLASALIFGAGLSTLFIWLAEIINACILFGLSRSQGRGFVEKMLGKGAQGLDKKLAQVNLCWLFLIRGVPLVPFRFLDLAAGLSNIPLRRYILAVVFASPIRIFWVQYILAGVGEAVFSRPQAITQYLRQHSGVYILSLLYLILAIVAAGRLKIKD